METNLKGKTVLVTEAVLNFGQATSLAFAREGCNLLLATREGNEQLERTAQEASSLGAKVATQVCDISNQGQAQALAQKAISEFGRIDVLVNIRPRRRGLGERAGSRVVYRVPGSRIAAETSGKRSW